MRSCTKILMTSTAVCALAVSANAADLPVKARPIPVEVYNWTGFYFGGHVGGGWLDSSDGIATYQRFTGAAPGVPHPLQTGTFNSNNSFAFGGGQAGYNWQFGSVVAGIEADLSVAGPRQNQTILLTEGPINDTVTRTRGLEWFGTVRGRLGYLFDPRVLAYVTGGFAYGHAQNSFNQFITGPGPVGTFVVPVFNGSTRTGWTVGGGLEYMISRQWSVKGEYQYLQLSDAIASTTTIAFNPGKGGNTGVFTTQSGDTKAHTVQVGLNYHFWSK